MRPIFNDTELFMLLKIEKLLINSKNFIGFLNNYAGILFF
jgi:hypothetical protein